MKIRIKDDSDKSEAWINFYGRGGDGPSVRQISFARVGNELSIVTTVVGDTEKHTRKMLNQEDIVDLVKHLARTWPELFEVEA